MKRIILLFQLVFIIHTANSQLFTVYDFDKSNFPHLKAKFMIFDNDGEQITSMSYSDFSITENDISRDVTFISCPVPQPPETISSVLVMDISGSMGNIITEVPNMDLAKIAGRTWVNTMYMDNSECAITSFDNRNFLNQDFTQDKNRLLGAINSLNPARGTSFDAALISPSAGGLLVAKKGKYKKVIVMITDGQSYECQTNEIITQANIQDCAIFVVTIGMKCPDVLKNIAASTGAAYFEEVTTVEQIETIYQSILFTVQFNSPCEIQWESTASCKNSTVKTVFKYIPENFTLTRSYELSNNESAELVFNPIGLRFVDPEIGVLNQAEVIVTAKNADFNITNISSSNPIFSISPTSFALGNGESKSLTVSCLPAEKGYQFSKFEFENNICTAKFYASTAWKNAISSDQTLKVTHPNGGEFFVVGYDTLITWEGIAEIDTVKIEYSYDNGDTWNTITDTAWGLQYKWENIPLPESSECLVKISQNPYDKINGSSNQKFQKIWSRTYGGNSIDIANDIIETSEGNIVAVGYSNSKDMEVTDNYGKNDYWVVKLNSETGDIVWEKNYGGSEEDIANSISEARDGNYLVSGLSGSGNYDKKTSFGAGDAWITKINSLNGDIIWEKTPDFKGLCKKCACKCLKNRDWISKNECSA